MTLDFTYPPTSKSGDLQRVRQGEDTFSSYGLKQSITWRIDELRTLNMENVPAADISDWATFIDYAMLGLEFQYHPDASASPPAYDLYTLDSTDWDPAYALRGPYYKFKIVMRKVVTV